MTGKSRVLKFVAIALGTVFVLIASVGLSLFYKVRGDSEVMEDIDRHFERIDGYAPTPAEHQNINRPSTWAKPGKTTEVQGDSKEAEPPRTRKIKSKRGKRTDRREGPESISSHAGIREIAPGTYVIDEGLMSQVQSNPQRFTGPARASIAQRRGSLAGFRITEIRPGSPVYAIGIRDGDVITAVNGYQLKSLDEVLVAIAAVRFSQQYRVDILRNGRQQSLYYRVDGSIQSSSSQDSPG